MSDGVEAIGEQELVPSRRGISFSELREGRCKFPLGTINDPPRMVLRRVCAGGEGLLRTVSG